MHRIAHLFVNLHNKLCEGLGDCLEHVRRFAPLRYPWTGGVQTRHHCSCDGFQVAGGEMFNHCIGQSYISYLYPIGPHLLHLLSRFLWIPLYSMSWHRLLYTNKGVHGHDNLPCELFDDQEDCYRDPVEHVVDYSAGEGPSEAAPVVNLSNADQRVGYWCPCNYRVARFMVT